MKQLRPSVARKGSGPHSGQELPIAQLDGQRGAPNICASSSQRPCAKLAVPFSQWGQGSKAAQGCSFTAVCLWNLRFLWFDCIDSVGDGGHYQKEKMVFDLWPRLCLGLPLIGRP